MTDVEQARKTGGMIALIPSEADARRLHVDHPNAERLDDLHVTMIYLGEDVTGWDYQRRNWVLKSAERAADNLNGAVQARAFAHATFNPDGGPDGDRDPCGVYLIGDVDRLAHVRAMLKGQVEAALEEDAPTQHEPYVPHLTAGYGLTAADLTYVGPVTFDRVEVHLGSDHTVLPLRSTGQKDMYASMAPMPYVRGLGASPSRPRQSPPPAIVERRRGPSLRGQVRRLKRRSRRAGVKGLTEARARLTTKQELDPGVAEILRVASGQDQHDRNLTRVKSAIARLEAKAPQRSDDTERCMSCHEDIVGWYDIVPGEKHGYPGTDAVVCLDCAGIAEVKRGDHHSSSHPDVPNKPGVTNWVSQRGGLPSYIRRVARHIAADSGYTWSHAIASAVNVTRRRAAKGNAAAAASYARWQAMKASKCYDSLLEAKSRL